MNILKKVLFSILPIFLLWLLFFGLGDKILYGKAMYQRILPIVVVFAGFPVSLYLLLSQFAVTKPFRLNASGLSVLVLGITFGIWSKIASESDIEKHEAFATGVIDYREKTVSNKRSRWTISASFSYRGKNYSTFAEDDNDDLYRIGDRVKVRFSTRNPENNDLLTGD